MVKYQFNPAPINQNNAVIFGEGPYIKSTNAPINFQEVRKHPSGCLGKNYVGGYKYRNNNLKTKKHLHKARATKKKYMRKNKIRKSDKKNKLKRKFNKKKSKKQRQRGGSSLGYSLINEPQNIKINYNLENIPYSRGYGINTDSSTNYGALANPPPYKAYAKCSSKVKI